jgi:pyruvate dehydrogenase (quinone)
MFGARVEKAGDLEGALRDAFSHDGPALVEVHTARHELTRTNLRELEAE